MSLDQYFTSLIEKIEASEIGNNGKDKDGFFEPTRSFLLQRAQMLKDLNASAAKNPAARPMLRQAWEYIVEKVPAEWLVLDEPEKTQLKKILQA